MGFSRKKLRQAEKNAQKLSEQIYSVFITLSYHVIVYMYQMNKKMEIRNVDVEYAGILWEGRIHKSPKNTMREARLQKQNFASFSEKADNNKGI